MFALSRNHGWPLAFLTSVAVALCVCVDTLQYTAPVPAPLVPHAHSSVEIFAGFVGCVGLTLWQLHDLLFAKMPDDQHWRELRSHALKLGLGVGVSAVTLLVEAEGVTGRAQTACRVVQGLLGAVLLIYAYLLVVTAFQGLQQVFALTAVTLSAACATVCGPLLGAWAMADLTIGYRGWHGVLAGLALLTNALLGLVYWLLPRDEADEIVLPGERSPLLEHGRESPYLTVPDAVARIEPLPAAGLATRWPLVQRLLHSPAFAVVLVLGPAAMVKGALEALLPVFAAPQGYTPRGIRGLYGLELSGFVVGCVSVALAWPAMSRRGRAVLTAAAAAVLGGLASCLLYSFGLPSDLSPQILAWVQALNGSDHYLFYTLLAHGGLLLGAVHASSALYLAELLESLEGWGGSASKQVAVGLWTTVWRLGSVAGFSCIGSQSWHDDQQVLQTLGSAVLAATLGFVLCAVPDRQAFASVFGDKLQAV